MDVPTEDADKRRAAETHVAARAAADPPLAGFLAECGQSAGDVPPMAEALEAFSRRFLPDFSLAACRKIGEGTYGEAFKSGETVLKIVPMGGTRSSTASRRWAARRFAPKPPLRGGSPRCARSASHV